MKIKIKIKTKKRLKCKGISVKWYAALLNEGAVALAQRYVIRKLNASEDSGVQWTFPLFLF